MYWIWLLFSFFMGILVQKDVLKLPVFTGKKWARSCVGFPVYMITACLIYWAGGHFLHLHLM